MNIVESEIGDMWVEFYEQGQRLVNVIGGIENSDFGKLQEYFSQFNLVCIMLQLRE